jgi:hypothetical protein
MAIAPEHWHVDKRIPIAIIFTILVQTAGVVWGAATIWASVAELRAADGRHETELERHRLESVDQEGRIRAVELGAGRMQEQLDNIEQGVNRIADQLDRILEAPQ